VHHCWSGTTLFKRWYADSRLVAREEIEVFFFSN